MGFLIFYLLLAIIISFVCSILEAVLLSVTPAYISVLQKKHPRTGMVWNTLYGDIDNPLSAILSLNTISHTLGAAGVGAQAQLVFGQAFVSIISAVLTFFILVFSEIIPKSLGAKYWRELAPLSAHSMRVIIILMYPMVWLSRFITGKFISKRRIDSGNRQEIKAQVELGVKAGFFEKHEAKIFNNLIRLTSLTAKEIMTPRTVMIALPENVRTGEVFENAVNLHVSRIPIYKNSLENCTGYILKSDLLIKVTHREINLKLRELKRPILTVPDSMTLRDLFERLLKKKEHISLLIDEYGGVSGIATLEDVLETLLGMEIVDELDTIKDMQVLARKQWQERARGLEIIPF